MQFIRAPSRPSCAVIVVEDWARLLGLIFALFGVTMAVVTATPSGRHRHPHDRALLAVICVILAIETKWFASCPVARRGRFASR
ncbi:hypothetical protein GCM10018952_59890 [Streptosporangium vulgare]